MSEVVKDHDWYEVLGLPRSASLMEIKSAYKKLAIKHHPDKNPNDEEAASRFALISMAYSILSDPQKKHIYDLQGNTEDLTNKLIVNINDLGVFAKFSFSFFNKCGIRVDTEISPAVLSKAKILAAETASDEDLTLLKFGETHEFSGESQKERFFVIHVSQEDLNVGVIVHCRSNKRDKFKSIFFDSAGDVSMMEESEYTNGISEANFLFLPFPNYRLEKIGNYLEKTKDPPIFTMLNGYSKNIQSIQPGRHVLCVYQNNWYRSGTIHLSLIRMEAKSPSFLKCLQSAESTLAENKVKVDTLKAEYFQLQDKLKALNNSIADIETGTIELIKIRARCYNEIIAPPEDKPIMKTSKSKGLLGSLFGN